MMFSFSRHGEVRRLSVTDGQAFRLEGAPGVLRVNHGAVWLTRCNDGRDHVLVAGEAVSVRASDRAVIEAWRPGTSTVVEWKAVPETTAISRVFRHWAESVWRVLRTTSDARRAGSR